MLVADKQINKKIASHILYHILYVLYCVTNIVSSLLVVDQEINKGPGSHVAPITWGACLLSLSFHHQSDSIITIHILLQLISNLMPIKNLVTPYIPALLLLVWPWDSPVKRVGNKV